MWLATVGRFGAWVYIVTQAAAEIMTGVVVGLELWEMQNLTCAQLEGVEAAATSMVLTHDVGFLSATLSIVLFLGVRRLHWGGANDGRRRKTGSSRAGMASGGL